MDFPSSVKASLPLFIFLIVFGQFISLSASQSIFNYEGSSTRSDSQTLGDISDLKESSELQEDLSSRTSKTIHHRQRRYITVNLEGQFNVGFLISTPIIIFLPSMSNLFNKWRKRRSTEMEMEAINFQDSPAVQHHLDKVSTYFHLLEIPETTCQMRATCEFAAEPEKFYPVSDMILRRFRDPILPAFLSTDNDIMGNGTHTTDTPKSLYKIFNTAADIGQAYGLDGCQSHYGSSCRYSMDKLLNMPVLKFWAGLESLLRLSFVDE